MRLYIEHRVVTKKMKYKVLLRLVQALDGTTDYDNADNDVFNCTIVRGATYYAHCEQRDTERFSGAMQIEGPSSLPTRITLCVSSTVQTELGRYFPWAFNPNHFELLSHPDHRMDFDSTPRSMEWHVAPGRLGMRFFVWFTKEQATGFWVPGVVRNNSTVPPPFRTAARADAVYQPFTRRPWCLHHRRHTEGHLSLATWGVPTDRNNKAVALSHVQCQRVIADLQKRCVVEMFPVGSSMCVIYCSSDVSQAHPHLNMQRVPFPPAWEYGFVGAGGYTTLRPFWYALCSVWDDYRSIATI